MRAHCDYSFKGLESTVTPALNSVIPDLISKFFREMSDYMTAYRGVLQSLVQNKKGNQEIQVPL